jgi:diguanylate cyclase (GGDEF)-like protein/PAS domain S-box-containing protein
VSIAIGNICLLAGIVALFIGLERFTGVKGRQIQNYVLLLAYFIYICFNFSGSLSERNIVLSAVSIIFFLQCCWLMLHRVDAGMRRVTRLTGIIFAIWAAGSLARLIMTFISPEQTNDFFNSGSIDALTVIFAIMISIGITISLILMVSQRLLGEVKIQEEKFSQAFRSSPYAITLTGSTDGRIFEVNDGFVDITGYGPAEAIGKTTLDLQLWVREADRLQVVNELSRGNKVHGMEFQFRTRSGEVNTGLFSAETILINNQNCILSSIADISARKHSEEALARSEERYRNILDNMLDSYIEVDLAGNFSFINESACVNLGYTADELIGRSFSIIVADKDEVTTVFRAYNEVFRTGEPHKGFTFEVVRKDGSTGYVETSISLQKDAQGEPIGFRNVGRDVTDRKQLEQKLLEMATHDALTNLPNRALLFDRFNVALANAQRNNKKIVIMSLDLDKFKTVNDTLGHDVGDKLLVIAADRLTGALRKSDTVARMGGDEFTLLLGEVEEKNDAVTIAEKILEDFRQPYTINGYKLNITVSIGIAMFPEDGKDMEALMKSSDNALYTAKQNGRDRYAM